MASLALFDLDNTLIDRDRAFRQWAEQFLRERSLDPGELSWVLDADDDGRAPRPAFFRAVKDRYGLPESLEALTAAYRDGVPGSYRPDPAVLEPLRALRAAGWTTAVVTNGPSGQLDKMRSAGLLDVLDGWSISEVEGVAKPERAIFEAAARRCGADLEGWMVGDTPEADIRGGSAAELRTIWLARGRPWPAADFAPDLVAVDVAHAVRLILSS